ncbi:MAG TPA: DUF2884 family protein [Rhodanobacteraceae bacterium]|jgi:hypothetical protein|nr:DUF2884 family protein [Rhodanobacteraceae bacterium]
MKMIPTIAATVLAASMLSACSPGIHGKFGYNVTFDNGQLVSHAPGHPDATVSADGSLQIGGKAVATTPQQRALLRDYYAQSKSAVDAGIATGKAGVKLGTHAVSEAIRSIFAGDSKQAQQGIETQANAIDASAQKLCSDIKQLHQTQQAIAAQLPAFKPYDAIGETRCDVSTTTTRTIVVPSSPAGSAGANDDATKAAAH